MELTVQTVNRMIDQACQTLETSPKTEMSQAVVILTRAGNSYCFHNTLEDLPAEEDRIVAALEEKNDTAVLCLIAVWRKGGVDVVSYGLREKLIALNDANREAWMPMLTVRTVGESMVKK